MVILHTKNQQSNGAYKILANIYFHFFFFFQNSQNSQNVLKCSLMFLKKLYPSALKSSFSENRSKISRKLIFPHKI